MVIRIAQSGDAHLLSEFGAMTWREAYAPILPEADIDAYLALSFNEALMDRDIADFGTILFLSVDGDRLCGYIKLFPSDPPSALIKPHSIELVRLYVHSQFKGRGIGTDLLQRGLIEVLRSNYVSTWLRVWEGNTGAIAFYEKHGFTVVGKEPYAVSTTSRDVLIMIR